MHFGFAAAATAALLAATPAFAQKPPPVYPWNEGWSADAQGIRHVSGLKCPSAAWKGLGPTAPAGFTTDPPADAEIDAMCQYYEYWDQGTPKATRFVVNLIRAPDAGAAAGASAALSVKTSGAPKLEEVTRGAVTYRVATWPDDPGHRSMIIARGDGEDGPGTFVIVVAPLSWPDAKVWPVVEALFKANP